MSRFLRARTAGLTVVLVASLVAGGLAPGLPPPVRAAEYAMTTVATYDVQPGDRRVTVSVSVAFENTTPDPAGQFSIFEVVDLAVHPGAADVTARDGQGTLQLSVAEREGFTIASVRPRQGVRYQDRTSFTVAYVLADGSGPQVRVRPSLVSFPVWSFGTEGRVTVNVPGRFEVSVDGDELTAERSASGWVLDSGVVETPQAWLAQLVAVGPSSYETLTRAVPLTGGTVDLQVRAWADDRPWGERTLELVAAALPFIEERIGLPYPAVGPLVVVESVPGPKDAIGELPSEGTQLLAGFDEPEFTVLHQLGHVWLSDRLVGERWITEGFASWAAAAAAEELEVSPLYVPQERAEELADSAFPLISWGVGEASSDQEAYGYAASWWVANELAAAVGDDRLRLAWQRLAAGIGPYDPVADEPPTTDQPPAALQPADSRALLDQLEAVSDADLAAIFKSRVFDEERAAQLPAREAARQAYSDLLLAAGGWGAPLPVTVDMAAWRFEGATERITETLDWLAERNNLAAAAERAGLALPQRLRDRYRTAGGGPDARGELEAEAAVVAAYQAAVDRSAAERGVVERIGLLGGPDPDTLLRDANALFADGDLRGAADATELAHARLEQAAIEGTVRIVAAASIGVALLVLTYALARRRRQRAPTDYTAAP